MGLSASTPVRKSKASMLGSTIASTAGATPFACSRRGTGATAAKSRGSVSSSIFTLLAPMGTTCLELPKSRTCS